MNRLYQMTPLMKDLLRTFGQVQATTGFYATARLPGPVEYPGEHYPISPLEPGEPALIVKISGDGESRITPAANPDGILSEVVQVMELPEDEFRFFEAFRPALTSLSIGAPGFLFEMTLVNLYGVFEAYLTDTIRQRLRFQPDLLSSKAKQALVLDPSADEAAVDRVVEREVRRITHGPITGVLDYVRTVLVMPGVTTERDHEAQVIALLRNCLLHNGGRVDRRLAAARPSYAEGDRVQVSSAGLTRMAKTLRDLAYAIDQEIAG